MGLSVACQYDLTNKSVSNEVDLGVSPDLKHSITQESIVDSPNVAMRVTDRRGESTGSAQVRNKFKAKWVCIFGNGIDKVVGMMDLCLCGFVGLLLNDN